MIREQDILVLVLAIAVIALLVVYNLRQRGKQRPALAQGGAVSGFVGASEAKQERNTMPGPGNALEAACEVTGAPQRRLSEYRVPDRGHVFIGAKTGDGKTQSVLTLLCADLAEGYEVAWLSPHATLYHPEDQPLNLRRLRGHFRMVYDYAQIAEALRIAAEEIDRRMPLYREGEDVGHALVLHIDEWPLLMMHELKKTYQAYVSRILREGRKCKVFLVLASQDALTETMGISSGLRSSFGLRLAGNIDSTTWRFCCGSDIDQRPVERGTWVSEAGLVAVDRPGPAYIQFLAQQPIPPAGVLAGLQTFAPAARPLQPIAITHPAESEALPRDFAPDFAGVKPGEDETLRKALSPINFPMLAALLERGVIKGGETEALKAMGINPSGTSRIYETAKQRLADARTLYRNSHAGQNA